RDSKAGDRRAARRAARAVRRVGPCALQGSGGAVRDDGGILRGHSARGRRAEQRHGAAAADGNRAGSVRRRPKPVVARRGTGRRARLDGSLFRWGIRWQRDGAGGVKEAWSASVAPNRQIARFTEEVPDTAAAEPIAADSARRVAEAFLRVVGLDLAALTPAQDS